MQSSSLYLPVIAISIIDSKYSSQTYKSVKTQKVLECPRPPNIPMLSFQPNNYNDWQKKILRALFSIPQFTLGAKSMSTRKKLDFQVPQDKEDADYKKKSSERFDFHNKAKPAIFNLLISHMSPESESESRITQITIKLKV